MNEKRFHSAAARLLAFCCVWGAVTLVVLSGAGCRDAGDNPHVQQSPKYRGQYFYRFETMGTAAELQVAAESRRAARRMIAAALAPIERVNSGMSIYRKDSAVSRLNSTGADGPVALPAEVLHVLKRSVEFSKLSSGAFDITYAPLRDIWRKAQRQDKVPSSEHIVEALKLVGSDGLIFSEGAVRFRAVGMKVDLGGIAKGYAIDLAAEALAGAGAKSAMVEIGGDMRFAGMRPDGRKWRVMVRRPPGDADVCEMYLRLESRAVATSGDYARYFNVGGRKFSHIIDPRSGRPVENVPSVTVVAQDAMSADALATAASVLGAEDALRLINSLDEVECLILAPNGSGALRPHLSNGFQVLLEQGR